MTPSRSLSTTASSIFRLRKKCGSWRPPFPKLAGSYENGYLYLPEKEGTFPGSPLPCRSLGISYPR